MFQISDVQIDKAEVALRLNIKIDVPAAVTESTADAGTQSVSNTAVIVSKSDEESIAAKVLEILEIQGVSCAGCRKSRYKLYPLSDGCKGKREGVRKVPALYCLELCCGKSELAYSFELTITEAHAGQGGKYCG